MRVLLVPNTANDHACETARDVAGWLEECGHQPQFLAEDAAAAGLESLGINTAEIGTPDLVVAFGGDGTILRAVHRLAQADTPILGVKLGRLGFMSGCDAESARDAVDRALRGDVRIERRSTLTVKIHMDGRVVGTYRALNEVVVSRGGSGRVIGLQLSVAGTIVSRVHADGIIVATATGSTAYALSAGGPVVSPDFGGLVVVPVAPHSLASRPLVTSPADDIEIVLHDPRRADAVVIVDGETTPNRQAVERVVVSRSAHDVSLVKLEGRNFYETVAHEFFGG